MRTNTLAVVAADDAGEVLGQYVGEIEDISASRSQRPRNSDYRLVLSQRPERLTWPIRAATNVERVGGLMRSVNHACGPVAKFVEVGNVHRLAVVVASTRQEVTVDYSDDQWFICRYTLPLQPYFASSYFTLDTGTSNHSLADIDRLLLLVEKTPPLGEDKWDRLALFYNANRPRGAPGRDFESLRHKFKVLYGTRKPGIPDMPPRIKKAKDVKRAIDEKASVVELDDGADDDQRAVEAGFYFDVDPDDTFYEDGEGESSRESARTASTELFEEHIARLKDNSLHSALMQNQHVEDLRKKLTISTFQFIYCMRKFVIVLPVDF
ncbi:hypothetical protein L914_18100 [Phytophthora nicotianae]|uniref:DUF6818 domain-containing protein n=3 Tax=Phytophthora nicotianae TaxID=4792 RepID=V9E855_PHYNI|nr:hypothetical protein F443_18828 [Phytophthora nicotianae P1569]ETL28453.1 hypothetical protein L916_18202 [Phytophthora nicotianae]ETM34914.1 hypothetical protein L914_18100 [Phytophthora nicotianae]